MDKNAIVYTIKKSFRAKQLRIAVYHDARVEVTVPLFFNALKIERFVRQKSTWIMGKLDYFRRFGQRTALPRGKKAFKQYRAAAHAIITNKISELNAIYNFSYNKFSIKNHHRRWGSCSKKGNLNFNYRIALLPEHLARYIVSHELCHLSEFNHSKKFWGLVAKTIPDFKQCKKELRSFIS